MKLNPNKQFLLSVLSALAIIFLFSSCEAYKAKICMTCATKTVTKDSAVYKTIVTPYDTIALIKRHVGKKQTFANCDSLVQELARNNNTITTTQDGVKSTLTKTDKGFTFHCETDSLKEIISLLRIENQSQSFHSERVEVPTCHLDHVTWWDDFWRKIGIALSSIIGAFLLYKAVRLYFKI